MDNEQREPGIIQTPSQRKDAEPIESGTGRKRRRKRKKRSVNPLQLRRNPRFILGIVLLIGIGSWIYYASRNPRQPKSAGTWTKTILPTGDIDSPPTRPVKTNDSAIESEPETRSRKLDDFLSRATITELIEEALDLREGWQNNASPISYIIVQQRAKIARRLLELEIDEDQRIFAYNEYIEAVATLDGLNSEGKMGAPGVRGALKEIGEKFSGHPDPVIGSKASLTFPLQHAHDYLESKETKSMLAFADEFEVHADKIMRDNVTTMQLTLLFVDILKKSNFDSDLKQCGIKFLRRLEKSQDADIETIAQMLREQIFFGKMELGSLVDRLQSDDITARQDVQEFFESLETNPGARLEIYQIAVNTIVEYKRLKMTAEAIELTNWLEKINSKNENETEKEKITKAVNALRM